MAGLIFILFYYLQSLPRISYLSLFSAIYHYLKDLLMHLTSVFSCILIQLLYALCCPVSVIQSWRNLRFIQSSTVQLELNNFRIIMFVCLPNSLQMCLIICLIYCLSVSPFSNFPFASLMYSLSLVYSISNLCLSLPKLTLMGN